MRIMSALLGSVGILGVVLAPLQLAQAQTSHVEGSHQPAMERVNSEVAISAPQSVERLNRHVAPPQNAECLPRELARADRLMRLHTQLMVTSLNCAEQLNALGAYQDYRLFTQTHADSLREAQAVIRRYLDENSLQAFDDYRTFIANDEAKLLMNYSTIGYCRMRESRFHSLIDSQPQQLLSYAHEISDREQFAACGN